MSSPRIPLGAAPGEWGNPARFVDECDVCGEVKELAPHSDLCPGCAELARWAAERVQEVPR